MKATIEIPDGLYRQVKVKSTLERLTVREVTISLFEHWVEVPPRGIETDKDSAAAAKKALPAWFGAFRKYAAQAKDRHDMTSVRQSIARRQSSKK